MKFPAELLTVLPALNATEFSTDADVSEAELTEEAYTQNHVVPPGRVTRVQDPELRSAIENHAVDRAIEYYTQVGGTDFVKLGKPYDIKLMLDGKERHVEVKGSSLSIATVELTINQVTHAESFQPTDLIVVDGISYERTADGVKTSGGRLRVWDEWVPVEDALSPRRFAYSLPAPTESPSSSTIADCVGVVPGCEP